MSASSGCRPASSRSWTSSAPAAANRTATPGTNLARLADRDQVKFVIADRADYEYARDVVRRHGLDARPAAVLFSPVHGVLPPEQLAEWVLADRLPVRLQVQLHKYLWGAETRGV